MKIRFLVPHRVASELLEQTPTLVTNLQSFDVLHVGFRVLQNTPSAFYGGIQTSCIDCLAFPCPKPVTVMDPGEGPRGTRPPPLIFRPNWGSTGGKKFFGDRTSPPPPCLSQGVDYRPLPAPSLISKSGSGTAVMRSIRAFWMYHWIPKANYDFLSLYQSLAEHLGKAKKLQIGENGR